MFSCMQRHASGRFNAMDWVQQRPVCLASVVEGSDGRKIVTSVRQVAGADEAANPGHRAMAQAVSISAATLVSRIGFSPIFRKVTRRALASSVCEVALRVKSLPELLHPLIARTTSCLPTVVSIVRATGSLMSPIGTFQ